jgi:hypothetical protein
MNELLVWQYIGIFFAALAAVTLFLYGWGRREERREKAGELAVTMNEWGFEHLAKLLRAYSIGNYLGKNSVTRTVHEMIDELKTDGGLRAMLKKIGWKVVEGVFLKNADDRTRLQTLLTASTTIAQATGVTPPAPTL